MPHSAFVFLPACLFMSHYIRKITLTRAKNLMIAFVYVYGAFDFALGTRVNV